MHITDAATPVSDIHEERKRYCEKFSAAVRGIPGNHLTKAMNALTPGMIWNKCSKASMASRYAFAMTDHLRGLNIGSDGSLRRLDLDRLTRMARARQAGLRDWCKVKS